MEKVEFTNNEIMSTIEQLYEKYFFLTIKKETFYEIVESEIKRNKQLYVNSGSKFQNRLCKAITLMIRERQKTKEKIIKAVQMYIATSLEVSDPTTAMNQLIQLFYQNRFPINVEICEELIQSSEILNTILETIIEENIEKVERGDFESISFSEGYICFLIAYCNIYEIEYPEQSHFEAQDMTSFEMYLNDMNHLEPPSEDDNTLLKKAQKGEAEAKKAFLERNLNLVIWVARNYHTSEREIEDLIQAGNEGLITATEKYDFRIQSRFAYYASLCIRRYIIRSLAETERLIRMPENQYLALKKYKKIKQLWEAKENRPISLEKIAEQMNLSIRQVQQLWLIEHEIVYLDEEEELYSTPIEERIKQIDLHESLYQLFRQCQLTSEQIKIIEMKYGLVTGVAINSLTEIGRILGLKPPRAAQYRLDRALTLLRNPKYIKDWDAYIGHPETLSNIQNKYVKSRR